MGRSVLLYHGSPSIIEKPVFGTGNPNNDYGLGFYCTQEIELAKEWSCAGVQGGVVNHYELDTNGLNIMRLSSDEYNILNWLAILINNRTFSISAPIAVEAKEYLNQEFLTFYEQYDVITGYRADDSYFSFAKAFLSGTISLEQLSKAMHLGELGEQVVLRSKRAFEQVQFLKYELVKSEIYYPKRTARDQTARDNFKQESGNVRVYNSVYILDILRERWRNDDPRLQRDVSRQRNGKPW